jgi:hypothetical protein
LAWVIIAGALIAAGVLLLLAASALSLVDESPWALGRWSAER